MTLSARRYRIRLYEDGMEVLADREYAAVLDFTSPVGMREAEAKLDELAHTLAVADGARGDRIGTYYLAVQDWNTGELECHWPAKTPPRDY